MANLFEHQSSKFAKMIYVGDSGSGKTGSLVSLLADGYKFKILDMDNGLDSLVQFARIQCVDKITNVEFETKRDTYTSTRSGPIVKQAKAFVESLDILT